MVPLFRSTIDCGRGACPSCRYGIWFALKRSGYARSGLRRFIGRPSSPNGKRRGRPARCRHDPVSDNVFVVAADYKRRIHCRPHASTIVGLMTQFGTVFRPICLTRPEPTFFGTQTVSHKTCVTSVGFWRVSATLGPAGLGTSVKRAVAALLRKQCYSEQLCPQPSIGERDSSTGRYSQRVSTFWKGGR
jgi:hypothetical protein